MISLGQSSFFFNFADINFVACFDVLLSRNSGVKKTCLLKTVVEQSTPMKSLKVSGDISGESFACSSASVDSFACGLAVLEKNSSSKTNIPSSKYWWPCNCLVAILCQIYDKTQFRMVKGIDNAFDHMELCFILSGDK